MLSYANFPDVNPIASLMDCHNPGAYKTMQKIFLREITIS